MYAPRAGHGLICKLCVTLSAPYLAAEDLAELGPA